MLHGRSDVSAASPTLMGADAHDEKLIALWMWEWVLKHSSDRRFKEELIKCLPFPDDVPRLKQMILITELTSLVSEDLDMKMTLDLLEALHCSFEDPDHEESEDMVLSKRSKLSSSEAANVSVRSLHDQTCREKLIRDGLRQPTLELKMELREWLKEDADAQNAKAIKSKLSELIQNAWVLFGPVYLERVEAAVIDGRYKPQGVSISLPFAKNNAGTVDDSETKPRNEEERGAELQKNVKRRFQDLERTRQALADSCAELMKVVEDPLPALLRNSEAGGASGVVRRKLQESHPSAQAQAWDESDDDFQRSPTHSKQVRLPPLHSPTRPPLCVSPSAVLAGTKLRRPKKKWSEEEVEVLKREVYKYGKGRWKLVLEMNKEVFQGRTDVDLKDKWRNLEKYNLV